MDMKTLPCLALPVMCMLLLSTASTPSVASDLSPTARLDELMSSVEREYLLTELTRLTPPDRLRELAQYGQRQHALGAGFLGMLPEQL